MLFAAIFASVAPAAAQTPLSVLCVSPDITVALSSGTISPQQAQCYSFPSGTAAKSFAGIPAGVNITGYFPISATQNLVTIDTTAALPTNGSGGMVAVTPHDVASYNPDTGFFSPTLYFAGASNSIPDGARIDALGMDGAGNLLLSFDITISVPQSGGGTITLKPADLVSFNGGVYALVFNGASAGIPDGTNLDGATMLPNTNLLLAFDEFGSIGGVDFTPVDVLEFNSGADSWVISFDGASADGWPDGSLIQGVWAAPVAPSPTPTPTATATMTATPTATATATPIATPTPVAGKLKVSPKSLNFGGVDVGASKNKSVTITNAGKITRKKTPLAILIEMESGVTSPFSLTQTCDGQDLNPSAKGVKAGSCKVTVTFTPTEAMKYSGTLMIIDNLEPDMGQSVELKGTGKNKK
jgi:Abnormal spindle-like microcephaly-assoc'd, ASPM-SPD-2-Hydin